MLCEIALPDFGYITNFGRVHLEGFGSFEGVVQGKTEMYRHLKKLKVKRFSSIKRILFKWKNQLDIDRILFGGSGADYKVTFLGADPFVRIDFEGHRYGESNNR